MVDCPDSGARPLLGFRRDALRLYRSTWKTSILKMDNTLTDRAFESVRYWPCTGGHIPALTGRNLTLTRPASKIRGIAAHFASIELVSINMKVESCVVDVVQDVLVLCGRPTDGRL